MSASFLHFDLAAIGANARATTAAALAEARAQAASDDDRRYVEVQAELTELCVVAAVKLAHQRNLGAPPHMVASALGLALGAIVANLYRNTGRDDRALELCARQLNTALIGVVTGEAPHDRSVVRRHSVAGVRGGRA